MSGPITNFNAAGGAVAQPVYTAPQPTVEQPPVAEAPVLETAPKAQPIKIEKANIEASYEYDQQLRQIIITLKSDKGDVVQQFPPEQVRKMLAHVMESISAMFDGRA